MDPLVIVGSGLAGWTLARELRKLDPDRPVTLLTRDDGDFYAKPSLSNALAAGKAPDALVTTPADRMAAQLRVRLSTRTVVSAIDRERRVVSTDRGDFRYGQLVLATGADPIRLPIGGDGASEVLSVNDLDDYRRLRGRLGPAGSRVAILGGGLIGCEFANDLALGGYRVVVLDPAPRPLAALLPLQASEALARSLREAGVELRFGDAVTEVSRAGGGLRLLTRTGDAVEADLVLSAVGLRPRTALAAAAGLEVARGVVVDDFGRTGDPSIFALGDCAQYGDRVLPYVMPTMTAARAIAATLAGRPTPIRFATMPVVVKTPALPIAVVPPAPGLDGDWAVERDERGLRMTLRTDEGKLAGFVVAGTRSGERAALTRTMDGVPAAEPVNASAGGS
jgi:rubredoxin-NAD+ reductase